MNFLARPAVIVPIWLVAVTAASGADWPQWRGPNRDNVSAETGLIKQWPEGGPKRIWTATGLGESVVSVAVAGGRAFTVGYRGDDEFAVAVDLKEGKKLWETRIGPAAQELRVMRGLSQRVPTVDGDRVYVTSFGAELLCLDVETGKERWRKNYQTDFAGKQGAFWFCDQPLVDGDRLVITPGGSEATFAALDKKTGAVIWRAKVPEGDRRSHSTLVAAEIAGVRQYVHFLNPGVVSVGAGDGRFLWRYDGLQARVAMTCAPLVRGDEVFVCNGYGVGSALLNIARDGERFKVEEVYRARKTLSGWMNTPTRLGDHIYLYQSSGMTCLEWKTGKDVWSSRLGAGSHSFTVADGHLYVRDMNGKVFLIEATPAEFRKKGEFVPPRGDKAEPFCPPPVVARGRLYLREMDALHCYDVAEPARPMPRKQSADGGVFVPTPSDIVDKMLELAAVKKDELVVDLGCGDGRILIAAANKHGARGWGIDIDPECVKLAREGVAAAKLGERVTIAEGDLFEADFSKADVVTLFLVPKALDRLVPKLGKLRSGARIVSHEFAVPGLKPDAVETITSAEDGVERKLYRYNVPFSKEK